MPLLALLSLVAGAKLRTFTGVLEMLYVSDAVSSRHCVQAYMKASRMAQGSWVHRKGICTRGLNRPVLRRHATCALTDTDHEHLYFLNPLSNGTWLQLDNVTSSTPGLEPGQVGGNVWLQ